MSRIIKCQVNDEYLLGSGVPIGAAGSHGDVILQLQFNDMWDGLSIIATFRDAMNENPVAIMLMPGDLVDGEVRTYQVRVPAEAKRIAGRARLTLSGYSVYTINDDGAITPNVDSLTNTATAFFRVLESDSTIADDGSITPTIAQQLQAEITKMSTDLNSELDALDGKMVKIDEATHRANEAAGNIEDAGKAIIEAEEKVIDNLLKKADEALQIAQECGDSELKVMSQRATTLAINTAIGEIYDNTIDVGEMIDGKFVYGNYVGNDADSSVTDFIPVKSGTTLKISNVYLEGNRSISAYDENKTNGVVIISNSASITEYTFTVTDAMKYIRVTSRINVTPVIEMVNGIVNQEIERMDKKIGDIEEELNPQTTIVPSMVSGCYIIAGGGIINNTAFDTTDYVEMPMCNSVVLGGINLYYSRAICMYNEKKQYIGSLYEENSSLTSVEFELDTECRYIRVSVPTGTIPTIIAKGEDRRENLSFVQDASATNENIGNFLPEYLTPSQDEYEIGYLSHVGEVVANDGYRHSPFIAVEGGATVHIKNLQTTGATYVHFYDKNQVRIGSNGGAGALLNISDYEFQVPFNVYYIRYTTSPHWVATTSVYYTETINRNSRQAMLVDKLIKESHSRIGDGLFKRATQFPIITIIDDDTLSIDKVELFRDLCLNNGIVGTYAVITNQVTNNEGMADTLRAIERQGFQMAFHCNDAAVHSSAYTVPNRDMAAAEADFVLGLYKMKEFGFTDYNYWMTPGGVNDEDMQNLARKWGMQCLAHTSPGIETTNDTNSRFNLPRYSLLPTDTSDNQALTELKGHIDRCAEANGWMLICMHAHYAGWETAEGAARFKEFVDYGKSKGCKFKTLSEAYKIREPIYRFYETF